MRVPSLLALLAAALFTGCLHAPAVEVSSDGASATCRGRTWTAAKGMSFFQRGDDLHLVSQLPEKPFDLKAEIDADGALKWPADPRLLIAGGDIRWKAPAAAAVSEMVSAGQLYPHEDHLHLTHLYDNEDFQAIYRAREDNTLPPLRRQVAAAITAMLVEEKLPAGNDSAARVALSRIDRILAKLRRGFTAGVPAGALADMLGHDFEIRDEGRVVEVEGKVYKAGEGLRFSYCSGHFHVEDALARWAHPVEFGEGSGTFAFPESPLFTVRPDSTVVPLPGPRQWRSLLESGQIQMLRDHWHLTAAFSDPSLEKLRAAAEDPNRSEELRGKAREALFELMRLKLDLKDEASFDAALATLRQAAARTWAGLEAGSSAPPTAPPPARLPDPKSGRKK